ncbi:MAG TPA: DUF2760 domain-containing protein [Bryobacteraceae bacterium]|nr:DUF2760 domain-containing protein [Bryobacteraceae bacterium]
MSRISLAFRSFFTILFTGKLPGDIAQALGLNQAKPNQAKPNQATAPAAPSKPAAPQAGPSEGALQILGILQRDSRLIDFLMEDISAYADDQVGAAVRNLHDQCRDTLNRYLRLAPVIDGVEGTFTKIEPTAQATVKLLGNVPASGKAPGGLLRHKGWRAEKIDLPPIAPGAGASVIAPAEVEVE